MVIAAMKNSISGRFQSRRCCGDGGGANARTGSALLASKCAGTSNNPVATDEDGAEIFPKPRAAAEHNKSADARRANPLRAIGKFHFSTCKPLECNDATPRKLAQNLQLGRAGAAEIIGPCRQSAAGRDRARFSRYAGACALTRRSSSPVTALPNSLAARDIAYYFHPATNARRHESIGPTVIQRGKGIHVYDDQGKEYIEGLAGLWSVAVGFGEERLVEAAAAQMRELPYYHSFSHKSHPAVIALAERLVKMAPGKMSKAHFTSSGSEANDLAIKMIWYFNNALGRPEKKKIIARQRGYHGVSIASASLTGLPAFHREFDLPLPMMRHVSCPHYWRFGAPGESEEAFSTRLAKELEDLILAEGPQTVAAFFGEPLMGAGGVIIPPRTYWEKIQAVCRRHDVLVVADEVITGFGRTGRMFGSETFGITPDILVVSKALTSSYIPLSALVFNDAIYQALADNSAKLGVFAHGFTASGHPVATAVALENLDIIEERDLVGNAARLAPQFALRLKALASHPYVGEARAIGLIGALEMVADKTSKAAFEKPGAVGMRIAELAQEEGLIIRAIGDIIAFCPPLIINAGEIDDMFDRFERALARLPLDYRAA
jgi:4-aminobutyrate---pyruvate transaminase